jgi:hypothetical protein
MLASIVIDYLLNNIQEKNIGIAYMYCSYRNRLEQTLVNLFGSLLKKLLQSQPSISKDMKNFYERHISKRTRPTLEETFQVLRSEMSQYSQVYIVVDALDEYSNEISPRELFLSKLRTLQATSPMNLMVTSRSIPNIAQGFQNAMQLEIRATGEDVRQYLEGQMFRLATCVTGNMRLQENITSGIIEAADGM